MERLFADWEQRWRECRECLPELIPAVQHLWERNESSRAAWLTYRGFRTGERTGELEIALRILQQDEALCLESSDKDSLSYGNQAVCKPGAGWRRPWRLLAREQRDHKTERERLAPALDIFTDLNMPRKRDAVQAELEKTTAADKAT